MAHIKKGDNVVVLSGAEKGKKGKVARMIPKKGTAVVEGINTKKKHQRPRQEGKKGQVIDISLPIRISKLARADKK